MSSSSVVKQNSTTDYETEFAAEARADRTQACCADNAYDDFVPFHRSLKLFLSDDTKFREHKKDSSFIDGT